MKILLVLTLCATSVLCVMHSDMYNYITDPQQSECIHKSVATENITTNSYEPLDICMSHCIRQMDFKVHTNGTPIMEIIPLKYHQNLTKCISHMNVTKGICSKSTAYNTCWNDVLHSEQLQQQIACNAHKKIAVRMKLKEPEHFEYLGCYDRCVHMRSGFINGKNELVVKKLAGLVPKRILNVDGIAKTCNGMYKDESNVCEQAMRRKDCFERKTVKQLKKYAAKLKSFLK